MKQVFNDTLIRTSWIILITLYLYQFSLVFTYSVDIPFKDEWLYLRPGHPLCLPENFSLNWLFARVAEHTIVTTNLITWINYKLSGLDFFKQKIVNYLIFGILLLSIVHLKDRVIGRYNFRMFPVFLFFLLSPIATENHSWAFQSQIHLVILFYILMLILMQYKPLTVSSTVVFISLAILAIYSFAAGVIFALVCLLFRNLNIARLIATEKIDKRTGLHNAVISTVIIGGITAIWFTGYKKPDYIPVGLWPNEVAYWDYLLNMLSFGFGFDSKNMIIGALLLLLSILPLFLFLLDRKMRLDPGVLSISGAIIAVLAVIASVTYGRASIGDPKTSRYVEITFLLIPFVSIAWWRLLQNLRVRNLLLSLLWASLFCSYLDNWSPHLYVEAYRSDRITLDCVNNYFKFRGDAICQEYWITPACLENAKILKIHFTNDTESTVNMSQ